MATNSLRHVLVARQEALGSSHPESVKLEAFIKSQDEAEGATLLNNVPETQDEIDLRKLGYKQASLIKILIIFIAYSPVHLFQLLHHFIICEK